jgi:outer membrane protein
LHTTTPKPKEMIRYALPLLLLFSTVTNAQERLTLTDAITRTLKKNYDISIANVATQQAERNNTIGNAGFLPNINAGISGTQSRSNVRNDLANGSQQINPNAINTNINPALTVTWTLFDGGRMFLVKKQLNEFEKLSQLQLRMQMQTMVSRTIQMYAQVALQQKQLAAVDTALHLAIARMQLTEMKYRTGAGAKVDYLQARVDYNARQADSLVYLASFAQACDSMSVLMGENEDKLYLVDNTIPVNTKLQPADKDRLRDQNLSLAAYKQSAGISHLNEDIAKSYALPTLSVNGGYVFNRSTSATGFALFTQSYGANGVINLSVPVFQGGNIRRQSRVASLQAMRDDLLYERQNTIIGRQYRTTWRNYTLAVAGYNLANENIKFARENLDVQLARFKVGAGTTLESREAENAFVLAIIRLYSAERNVKVYETQVLEIENKLLTEK